MRRCGYAQAKGDMEAQQEEMRLEMQAKIYDVTLEKQAVEKALLDLKERMNGQLETEARFVSKLEERERTIKVRLWPAWLLCICIPVMRRGFSLRWQCRHLQNRCLSRR